MFEQEFRFRLLSSASPPTPYSNSNQLFPHRISELESKNSSVQPARLAQGIYAKNDDKLVLSGNIAKPLPALPSYGIGGLSGAGMGLATIGVGVAGFGASTIPQAAPPAPSEADTFVIRDPDLGVGPESPASNRYGTLGAIII